ncbi:hypothetical protein [Sessilibacter corallicola]|uniref:hypothetical protein n=1 Tax=Sessilibacter corallicola TaxID=2904075 RepID=UPI001E4933E6|nr:hypothetical protein [Sessilibacter corallicola]MCE2030152.1 hypothetical protein [Sessilibacter corallicola]
MRYNFSYIDVYIMVKIKSKNQSGGITAHNVNIGNFQTTEKKTFSFFEVVAIVLGIPASIVTLLQYFEIIDVSQWF